jgi:hypothetical protein
MIQSVPPLPLAILPGDLAGRGRGRAATPRRPLQGAPEDWLRLVAHGCLEGERNMLILTEAGRARAQEALAARTRVAVGA